MSGREKGQVPAGGRSLSLRAHMRAMSSSDIFKMHRMSDGGCLTTPRSGASFGGGPAAAQKTPPQCGRPCRSCRDAVREKVHSVGTDSDASRASGGAVICRNIRQFGRPAVQRQVGRLTVASRGRSRNRTSHNSRAQNLPLVLANYGVIPGCAARTRVTRVRTDRLVQSATANLDVQPGIIRRGGYGSGLGASRRPGMTPHRIYDQEFIAAAPAGRGGPEPSRPAVQRRSPSPRRQRPSRQLSGR